MNTDSAHKLAQALIEPVSREDAGDMPIVEGYALIREIGRGGSGVVYEAISLETEQHVAIKLLRATASRSVSETFNEIVRHVKMCSDGIPHVYGSGWTNGQCYIISELIDGVDPITYAQQLDLRSKVELFAKITDVVASFNGRGMIHRDLKPSNILVKEDGTPVVLDLGISIIQSTQDDQDSATCTKPVGTVAYMSPEQARGENDEISVRWDVYALGVIGYELLTGLKPHDLQESATTRLEQVRVCPARSPRDLNPLLPKPLGYILTKACATSPSDRYETTQLLRDDLRRWLSREPVFAGPQSHWMRTLRLISKHPILSVAMLCAVIFIVSIGSTIGLVWWQNIQPYQFRYNSFPWASTTSIVSRSGRIFHTWRTELDDGIRFTGRILNSNDGKYAIVGLYVKDMNSGDIGLVGYRLGEYEHPAWVAKQHVPEGLSYAVRNEPGPHEFTLVRVLVADIFAEYEGLEVVSIHRHRPYSVCAIQVHSPDGKLLSEYYHDGWVFNMYWNPISHQLVCTGPNSDGNWFERGADKLGNSNYPLVIFAIRPRLGEVDKVIRHPGLNNGIQPVWYRCLMPQEAYSYLGETPENEFFVIEPSLLRNRALGYVEIQLGKAENGTGHATMLVDQFGKMIDSWVTDTWSAMHGDADPKIFRLEDLPQRVMPRKYDP